MNTAEKITIEIDSETAKAFKSASPELQKSIQIMMNIWLKEFISKDKNTLKSIMDDISDNAQARGLTQKLLENLLK